MPKLKLIPISQLHNAVPERVRQALAFLDKLKSSVVVSPRDLAAALGIAYSTLREYTNHPRLALYRYRTSREVYWGNRRTIAELKRRLKRMRAAA